MLEASGFREIIRFAGFAEFAVVRVPYCVLRVATRSAGCKAPYFDVFQVFSGSRVVGRVAECTKVAIVPEISIGFRVSGFGFRG